MKIITKIFLFSALLGAPAAVFADPATPPTGGDGQNGVSTVSTVASVPPTPSTGGDSQNGAVSNGDPSSAPSTPSTGGAGINGSTSNGSTSSAPSTPSTGGNGNNGSTSVPASSPTTPTTPSGGSSSSSSSNSSGGSSSSSGSSVGFSSGGGSSAVSLATPTITINSCPLLTSYLQLGANNDASQVAKLQAFLKESQDLDVTVNGTFDQQTENAVRAFQSKYLSEVMGPWGATQSSGNVYITTEKKINELACNTSLALNPSELAIIDTYKNQQNQNGAVGGGINSGTANASTTPSSSTIPVIGQSAIGFFNAAAVGGFASAWNNFWGSIWNHIFRK